MTMAVISAINAGILDELEEVGNLYILNIERSKLRDNSNPFSWSSSIFKKLFRFEKRMMQDIIAMTAPFLREYIVFECRARAFKSKFYYFITLNPD
ncbi:hypothetical protein FQA39_LY14904 [Lamprigera yunnana]|nr:hypothetical protein FQA39_LY14904 [Lamprigera yunnana]